MHDCIAGAKNRLECIFQTPILRCISRHPVRTVDQVQKLPRLVFSFLQKTILFFINQILFIVNS